MSIPNTSLTLRQALEAAALLAPDGWSARMGGKVRSTLREFFESDASADPEARWVLLAQVGILNLCELSHGVVIARGSYFVALV